MLTRNITGGNCSSAISKLDSLLHDYESEYPYLFKLVYNAAHSEKEVDLQQNYSLPNIARRLLESFLVFRQPSNSQSLHKKLENIDFDNTKKNQILRFLHTYSHAGQIFGSEHDLSILAETKPILEDILDLMNDRRNFDEMKKLEDRRN